MTKLKSKALEKDTSIPTPWTKPKPNLNYRLSTTGNLSDRYHAWYYYYDCGREDLTITNLKN